MKIYLAIVLLFTTIAFAQVRSVTMFTAFDLASACPTFVYDDSSGSGAEDGWVTVSGETDRAIQVDVVAVTATNVQFVVEARLSGVVTAARIWPSSTEVHIEESATSFIAEIPEDVNQVRLGMCITSDTAGAEDIDATLNTFARDRR